MGYESTTVWSHAAQLGHTLQGGMDQQSGTYIIAQRDRTRGHTQAR
jgi:hypothetical protein